MTGRLRLGGSLALVLAIALAEPAGSEENRPGAVEGGVDESRAQQSGRDPGDPWEPMNRRIFAFNEGLDRYLLEPVATGWNWVMPERVQQCIGNFFDNTVLPIRFANDLLQAKPRDAYETIWRAAINSTVGLGGLFDPASAWTVIKSDEDFGQTLGRWGLPSGPYLVLPLLGPSSPRDASGMAVDRVGYGLVLFVPFYVSVPAAGVDVVNDRARALESIRAERAAAFDFYTAVRSAYVQYRENLVLDRADDPAEGGDDEDLYYFDEDEQ